ncbi:MAG: alanine racemase, partial [Saccharofermentans sp.]|nr:alanine racemase [Saccharofermentans sp.]
HGFFPEEIDAAIEAVCKLDGVRLRGLMTMAPIESYEGEARKVFCDTRVIFDRLKSSVKDPIAFDTLSMGMSQDYSDAIKEGSTCVRIGTAIFGNRNALIH